LQRFDNEWIVWQSIQQLATLPSEFEVSRTRNCLKQIGTEMTFCEFQGRNCDGRRLDLASSEELDDNNITTSKDPGMRQQRTMLFVVNCEAMFGDSQTLGNSCFDVSWRRSLINHHWPCLILVSNQK
jgi:hypothetical protein